MTTTTSLSYADLLAENLPAMPTNEAEHAPLVAILESLTPDGRGIRLCIMSLLYKVLVAFLHQKECSNKLRRSFHD